MFQTSHCPSFDWWFYSSTNNRPTSHCFNATQHRPCFPTSSTVHTNEDPHSATTHHQGLSPVTSIRFIPACKAHVTLRQDVDPLLCLFPNLSAGAEAAPGSFLGCQIFHPNWSLIREVADRLLRSINHLSHLKYNVHKSVLFINKSSGKSGNFMCTLCPFKHPYFIWKIWEDFSFWHCVFSELMMHSLRIWPFFTCTCNTDV